MNNDLNNKKTKKRDRKNKPLLSATVDIVFKKLFIENPDLLSSLLESFLPLKSSIENIEIKNPDMTGSLQPQAQKNNAESQTQKSTTESSNSEPQTQKSTTSQSSSQSHSKLEFKLEDSTIYPEEPDKKMVVMDLKVKLGSGESINIEVQTSHQHGFTQRILFYLAKLFTADLQKGKNFKKIQPAYSLIFTTFSLFDEFKDHLSSFSMIRETHPHVIFSESMRIILVELPKFQKSQGIPVDLSDFWCYFLLKAGKNLKKEEREILLKNKDTKMALEHLDKMSQNDILRERALAREKNWLAYVLDKKGMEKEGMEKGMKKGRKKEKQAIALKMIKLNYSLSEIAKIVEYSEDEIKKLMK